MIVHCPTPSHAVAFASRLPPIGSAGDFHPQSLHHAQRTRSAYGLTPASQPYQPRFSYSAWYIDWGNANYAGCRSAGIRGLRRQKITSHQRTNRTVLTDHVWTIKELIERAAE